MKTFTNIVCPCIWRESDYHRYTKLTVWSYDDMGGYASSEPKEEELESDGVPDEVVVSTHASPGKGGGESKLKKIRSIWRSVDHMNPPTKFEEEIKLPFKLLCDTASQTEPEALRTSECIDDCAQTDDDIADSNNKFSDLYLSDTSRYYTDNSMQTDDIIITTDPPPGKLEDSLEIKFTSERKTYSEISVQTDNICGELVESCSQTEENTTVGSQYTDLGIQTDLAAEIAAEVWNDSVQKEREKLMSCSSPEIGVFDGADNPKDDNQLMQQRLEEQEKQIADDTSERKLLEEGYREKVETLRKQNVKMKAVVQQYEKVIIELTEQSHDSQRSDERLLEAFRDKEQLQLDLNSAETNLLDAYRRIEQLKTALDTYKDNDGHLNQKITNLQQKLQVSDDRYKKLKQQATEKIDAANVEIMKVRKQKELDLAGIEAALKKSLNRNGNLEKEICQKIRENDELSKICDELINKVSSER